MSGKERHRAGRNVISSVNGASVPSWSFLMGDIARANAVSDELLKQHGE